jgi:hypothetical protein
MTDFIPPPYSIDGEDIIHFDRATAESLAGPVDSLNAAG